MAADRRPLVMHVLYRFDTGGLENGVVNLINHMPPEAYRHMVVSMTEVTDFKRRLRRSDVECVALHKPAGHGVKLYPRFLRLLAQCRPAIVHTRNLGPLELQAAAAWAHVPVRVHGEHGRELDDLHGRKRKYWWMRRLYSPFVHRYVALSQDLQRYLAAPVGIAPGRIELICNGVDTSRFTPPTAGREPLAGSPFDDPSFFVFGTVGRMAGVKHQTLLARAFVRALALAPSELQDRLRLVMVGDGPLRAEAQAILDEASASTLAWLPGERADVPAVMRGLDAFVLPSLAEGISNTILEAMASGLPVIATAVGGNAELVAHGRTGEVVPSGDVEALTEALLRLAADPSRAADMGREGRSLVDQRFSLQAMVEAYQDLYYRELARAGVALAPGA
jgi:sugar transferase (PEP-CTERM/EpsH1 system associated)